MYVLCVPNVCVDIFTYENVWLDWRGFEANSPEDIEYYETREDAQKAKDEIECGPLWKRGQIKIVKIRVHGQK